MERLTIRNSDGSVSQPTHSTFEKVFNRLAEYEDAEADGRLIMPPLSQLAYPLKPDEEIVCTNATVSVDRLGNIAWRNNDEPCLSVRTGKEKDM